jgi:NitT/TauT family transport system permease protein
MKKIDRWAPLIPLVLFLGIWQFAVDHGWIAEFLLPSPWAVVLSLVNDWREMGHALAVTATAVLLGFALSALVGIGTALLLSVSNWALRALYPYAVVLQTLPIIAVAPLLVIWFGYGMPTVVASTFLASIFPVITASLTGLKSTDPALLDLFRLYRASRFATLTKLVVPFALPGILVGLRIGAGLAVIGAIVGELVGGGGLGSVVDVARTQQRVDKVFAAVVLASALGAATVALVNLISRVSLRRWHPLESGGEGER